MLPLLASALLVLQAPAPAPMRAVQVGTVTAVADDKHLDLAIALAQSSEPPQPWPGLGHRAPPPFRLMVVADAAALRRAAFGRAPAWGAGITIPQARLVIIRADSDPTRTLRHELAHLVLHDAVRTRVPLWFDEGYAVWASGEWDLLDRLALNVAVVSGATPTLDRLAAALRGDTPGVDAAYALAATAVLDLARRNPTHTLDPLFERLRAGEDFGAAVRATTGVDLEQFGDEWRRGVRRRYGVFTWLTAGGVWILVGGIVIIGTRLRRRRDAVRRAALDEGWVIPEEDTPSPPGNDS